MIITEKGNGWDLQFEYRPKIVDEIKKEISGVRYLSDSKMWFAPRVHRKKQDDGTFKEIHNLNAMEKFKKKYVKMTAGTDGAEQFFKIEELPDLDVSLPWRQGVTPYPFQGKGIARGLQLESFINGDEPGLGKEQGVNDLVLTPTGWTKMGLLKVGDFVIGSNGKKTTVTGVFPQGIKELYRVMFSDGFSVTAGLEHLWQVQRSSSNKKFVLTTAQLMEEGGFVEHFGTGHNKDKKYKQLTHHREPDGKCRFKIPLVKPVEFAISNELLIEPYTLGFFLGDGHSSERGASICLFVNDFDVKKHIPYNYTMLKERNSCNIINLDDSFNQKIKELGLYRKLHDHKFIPSDYLTASPADRLSLIQGLMDSDGHAGLKSTEFSTTSEALCNGIVELVQSLGGIARVKIKSKPVYKYKGELLVGKKAYRVNIKMPPGVNPFRCERKASAYQEPYHYLPERYIRSIKFDRNEEAVCISVDASDHLYVTDHYIVTHNTIQSIGTLLGFEATGHHVFPALVICPASLKENWRREIEVKFSHKKALILDDKNKHIWHTYYQMRMADIYIVNFESLAKFFVVSLKSGKTKEKVSLKTILFNPNKDIIRSVVIDESHKLKDPSTIRSKVAKGITMGKRYVIALTGTPVVNKPSDLISQLSIINKLHLFGGYSYFRDRYCQGGSGAANLNELNGLMNKHCFFRREKKEVLKDLPEKTREVMTCDITTREEYNLAKGDLGKFLKENGYSEKEVNKSLNAEIMVKIGVLKQISARGKLPELFEQIDELVEAGQKVVIFIHQKFMSKAILEKYPSFVSIIGDDTKEQKDANKDAFQRCSTCGVNQDNHNGLSHEYQPNDVLGIVCSIKSASVGHTLTASSRMIIAELPWHAADVEQMEARIDRIGQKNASQIIFLLGKSTIDEDIYKMIESKRGVANAITGSTDDTTTLITDLTRNLFNQR